MKKFLLTSALALLASACAGTPDEPNDEFHRLTAQVEAEIRTTEKTGFLWRDTERLLHEARQAKQSGQVEEAMKLANQALRQAQLAQQQAQDNANAGPSYPKE